jgi:hypothetical protein
LRDVARRQERLRAALAAAQATDARRAARGEGAQSAKVPVADPESAVLPNKEGGHAPNYTPLAAVDGARGFIVAAEIVDSESGATVAVVDEIEQELGARPAAVLADSAHGTGVNLTALAARGIAAYIPPARQAMRERLKTEAGRAVYGRRRWLCETPLAVLKSRLGLRQFLLRGRAKVATQWRWACAAFNLVKLAREVRRMRVKLAAELA